jgi:hypothetical protein
MNYRTGILINEIFICIAITFWSVMVISGTIQIFKKDFFKLKKTLLYILNSSVLMLGAIFYVRLAMIVQGPKEATKEASMNVLKNDCLDELLRYTFLSILATLLLLGVNFFYQKYILKEVNKRTLSMLAVIDFLLLLLLSVSAIFNYYVGISGEIDYYHKIVSP